MDDKTNNEKNKDHQDTDFLNTVVAVLLLLKAKIFSASKHTWRNLKAVSHKKSKKRKKGLVAYLWYAFWGLFSLGFLGFIVCLATFGLVLSYYSKDLPNHEQLKDYQPPIVTRVYAGDGNLMAEYAQEKRVFVPVDNIPDRVKNAFIAAEDQNFYKHNGVDYTAVASAVYSNIRALSQNKRPRGASTITQQVAKNFLLTNELSYVRKIKEAILATRIEKALSKDQLLELYLNEIYLGARTYGVAAAALQYFDKSLNELTIEEAAYLAALPKAPNNYHPIKNKKNALDRRNWVIGRMKSDGYITDGEAELAKLQDLQTSLGIKTDNKIDSPYFAEEIRRIVNDQFGKDSLYGGGLVVRSTLDPQLQMIAEQKLQKGLMAYDKRHGYRGPIAHFDTMDDWKKKLSDIQKPKGLLPTWALATVLKLDQSNAEIAFVDGTRGNISLKDMRWARKSLNQGYARGPEIIKTSQVMSVGDVVVVEEKTDTTGAYKLQQIPLVQGALVALDPHTGRVLAMQGGWQSEGVSAFNRATQAKRQPGSAFKPFVYLAALDNGFTPATLVLDGPITIEDRPGHFWKPTNYSDKYAGPTTIRRGVEKSKNLMTVRLADHIGMEKIAKYADTFGISNDMPPHLANALGAWETTLMDITAAYGELVNGGKKIEPSFIDRIQDRRGNTIFANDKRPCPNCGNRLKWVDQDAPFVQDTREQLADPKTAYQMVSILEGVVQNGTAKRIKSLGRPLGGKTGTTNESKDTWFIGFSPDLVVGVFVGFDNPRSLGKKETGSSVAVPIFKDFMEEALKDKPLTPFRIPQGIKQVKVNPKTGARSFGEGSIWEAFVDGTEPTQDTYILNEYGIVKYNPYQNQQTPYEDGAYAPNDGFYTDGIINNQNAGEGQRSSNPFSRFFDRIAPNTQGTNNNTRQQQERQRTPRRPNAQPAPTYRPPYERQNTDTNTGTGGLY